MEKISLDQIVKNIDEELNSQKISGKLLLDRLCIIEESSRKTSAYLDHKYAPFYYYLGKNLPAESFLEVGFSIGLLSCCFLTSCKTTKTFLGFKEKEKEFIPTRIGKVNIRKFLKKIEIYTGNLYDEELYKKIEKKWDIILINEEKSFDKQLEYLETFWPFVSNNGIVIVEYVNSHKPSKESLMAFCESKNLKPKIFNTRYGTGLIQKT